ncbi:mast cell protease 2-like [Astatotilapia calliptera]|uniref:Peptidase S1 domain-containing protein n=1 Tax=Astatotilapia calliptera TaxID=8154 RepID=A0A3P8NJ93_ASTCA|nr:mast cell protease 2-like [Astatotilapia calliptera]
MYALHQFMLIHVLTCLGQNALGSEIINGEKAPENSLLYMASVQNNYGHSCGGFLVSEDFVVTAAHCDEGNPRRIVLGTHDLSKPADTVKDVIMKCIHPYYIGVGNGNDIMLLKLSSEVQPSKSIQIIKLPSSEIKLKENERCLVAGWGLTKTGGPLVHQLRVVDVSVISPEVCRENWPGLPDGLICAGGYGTNKGFCQGDSGGPLICNGTAVGVVSFNKWGRCDYPDAPNIYVDIAKHLDWINEILKKKHC